MEFENYKNSWANDVLENIASDDNYLKIISRWFDEFSTALKKQDNDKSNKLQSIINQEHLGVVNELSWWKFLTSRGFELTPIPTNNNKSTSDFELNFNGSKVIFEVTTLNPAEDVNVKYNVNESEKQSIYRIITNSIFNKRKQIEEVHKQKKPFVLVLFNYDNWSGLGTQFYRNINKDLFSETSRILSERPQSKCSETEISKGLSTIIYLERCVNPNDLSLEK